MLSGGPVLQLTCQGEAIFTSDPRQLFHRQKAYGVSLAMNG